MAFCACSPLVVTYLYKRHMPKKIEKRFDIRRGNLLKYGIMRSCSSTVYGPYIGNIPHSTKKRRMK